MTSKKLGFWYRKSLSGMGSCQSKDDPVQALPIPSTVTYKNKKLLIHGIASSGKTTLFKSLKHPFGPKNLHLIDKQHNYKHHARQNILNSMCILIDKCKFLYKYYNEKECYIPLEDEEIKTYIDVILDFRERYQQITSDQQIISDEDSNSIATSIRTIWGLDGIRKTYEYHRSPKYKYTIMDNFEFWVGRVYTVMSNDYKLNETEWLYLSTPTTDHEIFEHQAKKHMLEVHDFGGKYDQRLSWIDEWNNVDMIIFCAALDDYCKCSRDKPWKHAMWESVELFGEIINHKYIRSSTEIFIVFTKNSSFRECLRSIPFSAGIGKVNEQSISFWIAGMFQNLPYDVLQVIVEFYGDPNVISADDDWKSTDVYGDRYENTEWFERYYDMSLMYIIARYQEMSNKKNRVIYSEVVEVTEQIESRNVLLEIQSRVIRSQLKRGKGIFHL